MRSGNSSRAPHPAHSALPPRAQEKSRAAHQYLLRDGALPRSAGSGLRGGEGRTPPLWREHLRGGKEGRTPGEHHTPGHDGKRTLPKRELYGIGRASRPFAPGGCRGCPGIHPDKAGGGLYLRACTEAAAQGDSKKDRLISAALPLHGSRQLHSPGSDASQHLLLAFPGQRRFTALVARLPRTAASHTFRTAAPLSHSFGAADPWARAFPGRISISATISLTP